MSKKVIIDGKEYTERTISHFDVDGVKTTGYVIVPEESKKSGTMNLTITVSSGIEESVQSNSPQMQSVEKIDKGEQLNISEVIENKEAKSWLRKIIDLIKRFIKK